MRLPPPKAFGFAVLASCCALAAVEASAQTIRGLVLERHTYRPLSGAEVTMVAMSGDTVASGRSDERGLFSVTAHEPADYRLVVRALGYRSERAGPFTVLDQGLQVIQVELDPSPVPIEGVDVEARGQRFGSDATYLENQGFYSRRETGTGHFFGPTELTGEAALMVHLSELFDRVPGVRRGPGGTPIMRSTVGRNCASRVLVDGVVAGSARLDVLVSLEEVAAVEVYTRSVRVPLEYQWVTSAPRATRTGGTTSGGVCGLVVIWTKH